jgi:hypothetical protein
MKMDVDSIVVIIVSILFLIISGLTKRRKKKPAVKSSLLSKQTSNQRVTGKGLLNQTVSMINNPLINNPFDKLEKMFNIPEQTDSQEGESLEVGAEQEPGLTEVVTDKKATSQEVSLKQEAQSLEVIVDEVEEYLKEKEISKTAIKTGKQFDEMDLTQQEKRTGDNLERKPKVKIPLFENVDDIKKAVIYSEILNRKEY